MTHAELEGPGWNDIVVDGRGNAYVNTVGFDMMAGEEGRPWHWWWPVSQFAADRRGRGYRGSVLK